jgi:hypothetical protein
VEHSERATQLSEEVRERGLGAHRAPGVWGRLRPHRDEGRLRPHRDEGRLRPHRDYFAVARRATAANEAASWMAISERTLRSRPMAAFFSPLTRRE